MRSSHPLPPSSWPAEVSGAASSEPPRRRGLEKAGMEHEGTLRSYRVVRGQRRDHHLFAYVTE